MEWKDCNFLKISEWKAGHGKKMQIYEDYECKIQMMYGTGSHYPCSKGSCILIKLMKKDEQER